MSKRLFEAMKKFFNRYSVIMKRKFWDTKLKLERDASKINKKFKNRNWEVRISDLCSFHVLSYKTEDVLSMFCYANKIKIRKSKKAEVMAKERIFMSNVYMMLLDELTEEDGELESDEIIGPQAQKMWDRIFEKINETNKYQIMSSQPPYRIKKVRL